MPEFKDPNNYYLLRAVPHEQRVRLYKVENGKRTTFTGKNLAIPVDTWHELKLVIQGRRGLRPVVETEQRHVFRRSQGECREPLRRAHVWEFTQALGSVA